MRLKIHYRLLAIVIIFTFTLYLLQRYISSWRLDSTDDFTPNMESKVSGIHTPLMEFFHVEDPIEIVWSRASTPDELKTRENQMITVDVDSELMLDKWLNAAKPLHRVGLAVHFKNLAVLEPCLHRLYDVRNSIRFPVIVRGNVELANTDDSSAQKTDVFNLPIFLFKLKTSYPDIRFSLGHVPTSVTDLVQLKFVETLTQHIQYFTQPVFFSVCASVVKHSWIPLRWLLQQSDSLSLIVTSKENHACSNISKFDLLYVRNDWYKDRVFWDIPEVDLIHFRSTVATAGNPLHYFNLQDAAAVTWAHRVNSKTYLKEALEGNLMFIEADVIHQSSGDLNQGLVMAHPPDVTSDLTLKEWIDAIGASGKGMKLDFKSIESVEPALKLLANRHATLGIKQPVWLNADILTGPNTDVKGLNGSEFLSKINNIFPEVRISIGWTTKWEKGGTNGGYTKKMVDRMNDIAKHLRQPVTFPVRASLVRKSWEHFEWLLKQSRGYSLTLWTPWPAQKAENVAKEDIAFIRNNTEPSRVYFDLPSELMPV